MKLQKDVFTIAKGIAITCVVIGHTKYLPLQSFVYLFHLAVFYFVAGYFFKEKYTYHKKEYVIKRIHSLYLPYVKYMLFFLLMHNLFLDCHLYSENPLFSWDGASEHYYQLSDFIKKTTAIILGFAGIERMGGALWFLRSLFTVSISYCFISYFLHKNKANQYIKFFVIIALYFLSYIAINNGIKDYGGILRSNVILLIFFSGRMYSKYETKIPINNTLLTVSFAILCISAYLFRQIEVAASDFVNPFYFIIISLIGCYFVIALSHVVNNVKLLKKIFILIGEHSFAIMALHIFAFKLVNLIQIGVYKYNLEYLASFPTISSNKASWWIIYVIIGTLIPIIWMKLLNKIINLFK